MTKPIGPKENRDNSGLQQVDSLANVYRTLYVTALIMFVMALGFGVAGIVVRSRTTMAFAFFLALPMMRIFATSGFFAATRDAARFDRTRIDEIRADLRQENRQRDKRAELLELESTVEFREQAVAARRGGRAMLTAGILIVLVAIVGGVAEIRTVDARGLSTGDGIVRASVIGAVFYLAGQMFRRATTLERRADDLDRAVVALRHGKDLTKDIESPDLRDKAVAEIYTSHLAASSVAEAEDNTLGDVLAALLKRS